MNIVPHTVIPALQEAETESKVSSNLGYRAKSCFKRKKRVGHKELS